jgi:hypothetical protein
MAGTTQAYGPSERGARPLRPLSPWVGLEVLVVLWLDFLFVELDIEILRLQLLGVVPALVVEFVLCHVDILPIVDA